MRTSWLRVRTPVFSKSCCSTALTELSEIEAGADFLIRQPFEYTFEHGLLALGQACARRGAAALPVAAAMMERVTAGSSQTSPETTFLIASTSRLGGLCFRKPLTSRSPVRAASPHRSCPR